MFSLIYPEGLTKIFPGILVKMFLLHRIFMDFVASSLKNTSRYTDTVISKDNLRFDKT